MAASLHCLSSRVPGKPHPFYWASTKALKVKLRFKPALGKEKIMGCNYRSLIQLIKLIHAMSGISYQNKSVNMGN